MLTDIDLEIDDNNERFERILNQFIEIASWNFDYRLIPSRRNDAIDTMAVMLNMLSDEVYFNFFESRSKAKTECQVINFLLDNHLNIISSLLPSGDVLKLNYKGVPKNLTDLLTSSSGKTIKQKLLFKTKPDFEQEVFSIEFIADTKLYRSDATLFAIDNDRYVLTAFRKIHRLERRKLPHAKKLYRTFPDHTTIHSIKLARKLSLYIQKNLHTNLPSIPELAAMLDTNPTTLKTSFKNFYNTTINKIPSREKA